MEQSPRRRDGIGKVTDFHEDTVMLRRRRPDSVSRSRRVRRLPLAMGVAAAALAGAAAGAATASAASTTTAWYSIDQHPANASSSAQFLTATSTGQVVLTRYQSGEMRQQWTPTYPEWPASPAITSNNPLGDFFETVGECIANWGCPFTANAGGTHSARKFVNRMYATCLTFKPTGSVTTRVIVSSCGGDTNASKRQVFTWEFSDEQIRQQGGIPRDYSKIFGTRADTQGRCLDSAGGSNQPGTNAAALDCLNSPTGTASWSQEFRLLQSGSATCRRNYPGTLCGLGAPVH